MSTPVFNILGLFLSHLVLQGLCLLELGVVETGAPLVISLYRYSVSRRVKLIDKDTGEALMSQIAALKMELTHELETTKQHFKQLADADFSWKPHEKSMPLGRLASHCVESLAWAENMLHHDVFDFDPASYTPTTATNLFMKYVPN